MPEYFGVYASSDDGTDRWIADFADVFRAEQYARLFSEPTLVEQCRYHYRCTACGLQWSDVNASWWANCQVCEERDIEPHEEEPI